ncbi:MAG: hypothetical protein M0T73_17375 [Deltaproteobacteria bacterium]|nr:hypothetical protein [Deltaproteobacteria bacterium]
MENNDKTRLRKDEELLKTVRAQNCDRNDIYCIDWLLVGNGPII